MEQGEYDGLSANPIDPAVAGGRNDEAPSTGGFGGTSTRACDSVPINPPLQMHALIAHRCFRVAERQASACPLVAGGKGTRTVLVGTTIATAPDPRITTENLAQSIDELTVRVTARTSTRHTGSAEVIARNRECAGRWMQVRGHGPARFRDGCAEVPHGSPRSERSSRNRLQFVQQLRLIPRDEGVTYMALAVTHRPAATTSVVLHR